MSDVVLWFVVMCWAVTKKTVVSLCPSSDLAATYSFWLLHKHMKLAELMSVGLYRKLLTGIAALTPITVTVPPLSFQPTSQSLSSCLCILTASPCDCSQPTGWLHWGMTSLTSWFPPAVGELHFLLRVFVLKWRLAPRLSLGCPLLPRLLPQLTDVGMY